MEQIIHSSTICNPIHSSSTINTQHNHHNSTIPLQPSTPNQSIQSSIHSQSLNHLLTNSKSFNHNTSLNFSNTFPILYQDLQSLFYHNIPINQFILLYCSNNKSALQSAEVGSVLGDLNTTIESGLSILDKTSIVC